MKKITEITRRDIVSLFIYGKDTNDFLDTKIMYPYYGRLSEIDFLKRLYDLKKLPSFDSRFTNAEGDIWQHTVNNDDYENGWVFDDDRFELSNGDDDIFLKFLCAVFHPAVRNEKGYWKEFLKDINELLRKDGYELFPDSKVSGRDVYGWREYDPNESVMFVPFSIRHEKEIKDKILQLKILLKTRNQIFALLNDYDEVFREMDETGWQYDVSTSEKVFHNISQFYKPMCFNDKGEFVETSDMKQFITKSSPFYVFDAIEMYEKYNNDGPFEIKVNKLFRINNLPYILERGCIESIPSASIKIEDISTITEKGLKDLIAEADKYYRAGTKEIAVEKLWDAFERLKTYYSPALDKAKSADKIINDMSGAESHFIEMYKKEFKELSEIGNNFRIRHHETNKIDILDERQYDFFYRRCLALISVAILYLQ